MWQGMHRESLQVCRSKTARLLKFAVVPRSLMRTNSATTISLTLADQRSNTVHLKRPGRITCVTLCDRHYLCSRSFSSCQYRIFRRRLHQKNVGVTAPQTMRTLALTMEALKSALATTGRIYGKKLLLGGDWGGP